MRKIFIAIFLTTLFILEAEIFAFPVEAHYTLGRQTGGSPFRLADFDVPGHAPGPIGYVWPGGGEANFQGDLTGSGFPPGYQSPFTPNNPLQVAGNAYSPFSAILTSTSDHPNKGDLIFGLTFSRPQDFGGTLPLSLKFVSLTIYLPPEFLPPIEWSRAKQPGDTSNIVTTITNNYFLDISVDRADSKDPFGPGWWVIHIRGQLGNQPTIVFTQQRNYGEWYYVRVNEMTAPKTASRYFFKMFLNESFPVKRGDSPPFISTTVPVENYPVLLVKGEVDPGVITGAVRYGDLSGKLFGSPLQVPGRVRAIGVATDPVTGRSTGRQVEARGYFNASALGHYEIEGVAPGIYSVFASAAGYPEQLVSENVVVLRGQSVEVDFLLKLGATVKGSVFSKRAFGTINWPSQRPIAVEIYDDNAWQNLGNIPWELSHLKSFSPINLTHSPYTSYVFGNTVWTSSLFPGQTTIPFDVPPVPKRAAFPWEGPIPHPFTTSTKDPLGVHNGVGPAQTWWVNPTTSSFNFQFGIESFFGAPTEFSGHIPQVLASWVNGLTPGTYFVRAWVTQYVQTDLTGNFIDYQFTVAGGQFAGAINQPMDLFLNDIVNKTIHFHDLPGSLIDSPVGGPDPGRYTIGELFDSQGRLAAFNFTYASCINTKLGNYVTNGAHGCTTTNRSPIDFEITLYGFGMAGPNNRPNATGTGFEELGTQGMRYFMFKYRHIRDYGILPGTYTVRVYMRGFVQQTFESAVITIGGGVSLISNHMFRGASVNVTVFSRDFQQPRIFREWIFPGTTFEVGITDTTRQIFVGYVRFWDNITFQWLEPTQVAGQSSFPFPGFPAQRSKLKFNGSAMLERFGPDRPLVFSPNSQTALRTTVWLPALIEDDVFFSGVPNKRGFLYRPDWYRRGDLSTVVSLETSSYSFEGNAFGYVQKQVFSVFARKGSEANMRLDLITGVIINAQIVFKKEGNLVPTPFDMFTRLRAFNEQGNLVGAWVSSEGVSSAGGNVIGKPGIIPAGALRLIPAGTRNLAVDVAGFGGLVFPEYTDPDQLIRRAPEGIDGFPNYPGSYTIEFDSYNAYPPNAFFPPVDGILLGESYHIIGGTTGFVGDKYKFNHLGPWEQRTKVTIPSAQLSGSASVVFEVDLRPLVQGSVAGFSFGDELRSIAWSQIIFQGKSGREIAYSLDGFFELYVNPGDYTLSAIEWTPSNEGHISQSIPFTASEGATATGINFFLKTSGLPIPEFDTFVMEIVSLFVSIFLLSFYRKRKNSSVDTCRLDE